MNDLRPRQHQAVDDIVAAYKRGFKAPILRAGTGFGKTHTAARLIRRSLAKGKRVWFLAHLDSLLTATARKLTEDGIKFGWIWGDMPADPSQQVQIVSVQTVVNRLDRQAPVDLLIVDESHLAVAESYQRVFAWAKAGPKYWQPGGAWLLHLTASPQRLDGRGMGEVADCIVETCSTQTLIDEGLLVPVRYFEPTVKSENGKRILVGDPLDHYRKLAAGRPTIAFCISNEFAAAEAARFKRAGLRTMAISADSDTELRERAEWAIQNGELDVVFNCKLWIAGIDVPAVSCILDMAGTDSLVRFLQGGGRGFRTHPGKEDLIYLDCVGNRDRHGDITAEREWTLDGAAQGSGRVVQEVPVRQCSKCFATMPAQATRCMCGAVFPVKPREVERVDGNLTEVSQAAKAAEKKAKNFAQVRADTLAELEALAIKRNYARPSLWARAVYQGRIKRDEARRG